MSVLSDSESKLVKRLWERHREVTTFNGVSIYRDAAEALRRAAEQRRDAENSEASCRATLKELANEQRSTLAK